MSDLFEKAAPATLRLAATALTGALVASDELAVENDSIVTIELVTTLGTGGTNPTIEVHPEVTYDGTTWGPAEAPKSAGTPASGAVSMELLDPTYTITVAGTRSLTVPVYGATKFRVSVRETGGPSPYGTCQVRAVRARLGV